MRIAVLTLLTLLIFLQLRLWFGEGGVPEIWRLKRDIAAQQGENAVLRERNAALDAEVQDLKHGTAALEERARIDLGMIGRDETFYRVVGAAPSATAQQ